MEDDLQSQMEIIRKKVENLENEGIDKLDDWKRLLDDLNSLKVKIYAQAIFSENEEFKEIKAEDLKFLLLSFYQAEVIQKFMENREMILTFALKFYNEFFKLLEKYDYLSKDRIKYYRKITDQDDDQEETEKKDKKPTLDKLAKEREEKILAFKYKKALSEKLKKIEKEKDYDNNREYWVSYIELAWLKMIENIKMINMELESIKFINNQKKTGEYDKLREMDKNASKGKKMEVLKIKSPEDLKNLDPNNKLTQNLNVITSSNNPECNTCIPGGIVENNHNNYVTTLDGIIGKRTNAREMVFRPTHLPTMTLNEFAEKEKARMDEMKIQEEEAKKNQPNEDSDDEEVAERKIYEKRAWDDWKDLNPKGSGNTKR